MVLPQAAFLVLLLQQAKKARGAEACFLQSLPLHHCLKPLQFNVTIMPKRHWSHSKFGPGYENIFG